MITKFILEELLNFNGSALDFLNELSNTKRNIYLKARYPSFKPKDWRKYKFDFTEERLKISKLVSKLKKEGFVENNSNFIKITNLGKKKLEKLKKVFHWPKKDYKPITSDDKIIFIFDIPNNKSHFRHWLRFSLISLGFQKLQKSVWIGQLKIPKDFLDDLEKFGLENCIHIFKVTKTGTL